MKRVVICAMLFILLVLSGCSYTGMNVADIYGPVKEITKTDVFSVDDITSNNISVMSISLGDDANKVMQTIGIPDKIIEYEDASNWEYGPTIGTTDISLLYHIENEKVTRITIAEEFDEFLHGKTKLGLEKIEMYSMFGKPDRFDGMPGFTIYVYNEKGLDISIKRDKMIGFSLFEPGTD